MSKSCTGAMWVCRWSSAYIRNRMRRAQARLCVSCFKRFGFILPLNPIAKSPFCCKTKHNTKCKTAYSRSMQKHCSRKYACNIARADFSSIHWVHENMPVILREQNLQVFTDTQETQLSKRNCTILIFDVTLNWLFRNVVTHTKNHTKLPTRQ